MDKEKLAQIGWQFEKRYREETGRETLLFRCEKCEDTGFLHGRKNGITYVTPCVCRLQRRVEALSEIEDERKRAEIETRYESTKRKYVLGELMPPSRVSLVENEERKNARERQAD